MYGVRKPRLTGWMNDIALYQQNGYRCTRCSLQSRTCWRERKTIASVICSKVGVDAGVMLYDSLALLDLRQMITTLGELGAVCHHIVAVRRTK